MDAKHGSFNNNWRSFFASLNLFILIYILALNNSALLLSGFFNNFEEHNSIIFKLFLTDFESEDLLLSMS